MKYAKLLVQKQPMWLVDWLQDIDMVINISKTEAIYFLKYDQIRLNIEVDSIKYKLVLH